MTQIRWLAVLLGALVPALGIVARPDLPAGDKDPRPKLAVLLVFDQMRADYLTRFDDLFVADGFRRLEADGAWFQNCHYPYATTVTGAGHATLATGCAPAVHGIVSNEWYDRASRQMVNCVHAPKDDGLERGQRSVSPERLLVPTVGDRLKEATEGRGRVVSISLKDRSAVLLAGRRRDHLCCWHDAHSKPGPGSTLGRFVRAEGYYTDVAPRSLTWLRQFNDTRPADEWWNHQTKWNHLYDDAELNYAARCKPLPDALPTFPHLLRRSAEADADAPSTAYYSLLHGSPFGNDLLLKLAEQAVEHEQLGRRGSPDLLCVSFSSNDLIGHGWGPDSPEVLDVTLRSDLLIRDLLRFLDAQVGKGRYLVCLSSDHGVCPLPEVSHAEGKRAQRILPTTLIDTATAFLHKTYPGGAAAESPLVQLRGGKEAWNVSYTGWLYLNDAWLDSVRPARKAPASWKAEVGSALAAGLAREQPAVWAAFSREELLRHPAADDSLKARVGRSFHPERCGDVMVIGRPYYLVMKQDLLRGYNTTHGTPHAYDTHVPLLVYGPGVRPGVRKTAVTPLTVAAVLAHALGIEPPARATEAVPAGLFSPYAE